MTAADQFEKKFGANDPYTLLDSLDSDPRWKALLGRIGLPKD